MKLAADVAVLSAYQTGPGKDVRAEGLISLSRGFMHAGYPRVAICLWKVDDKATAELIKRFYRGMLVDKLCTAKALQSA